jgi:hypothetical protein
LHIVPLTFREASAFVARHHRHHKPPRGCKFTIGVVDEEGELHGVAMVGRPVARSLDNGYVLEVNRTCTDGTANANSLLYATAWRVAREMGYLKLITYTQAGESGTSLRAAGWKVIGERKPRGSWREATADERLRRMRDPDGRGGVQRTLWEANGPRCQGGIS